MSELIHPELVNLRDIHLPVEPGWWPPAYGWWIVAAILALVAAWAILWGTRRRRQLAPYRQVRREARYLTKQRLELMLDARTYADSVNALYKRVLVHVERRGDAAGLYGQPWLLFLADRFQHSGFLQRAGTCLGSERYEPRPLDDSQLPDLVRETLAGIKPPSRRAASRPNHG